MREPRSCYHAAALHPNEGKSGMSARIRRIVGFSHAWVVVGLSPGWPGFLEEGLEVPANDGMPGGVLGVAGLIRPVTVGHALA